LHAGFFGLMAHPSEIFCTLIHCIIGATRILTIQRHECQPQGLSSFLSAARPVSELEELAPEPVDLLL
jgi:hypothetical protein